MQFDGTLHLMIRCVVHVQFGTLIQFNECFSMVHDLECCGVLCMLQSLCFRENARGIRVQNGR